MDDERFGTLLLDAVRTLEPPIDAIVAGGMRRGRRRVRLIRTGEGMTAVGVVAALAALVVALLPDGSRGGQGTPPAGSLQPAPVDTTVLATPHRTLLQTALDTLPRPGTTSHYEHNSSPGYLGAAFVYDDGQGAARISVSLDYPPSGGGSLGAACQISECHVLADGSKLAVYQGNGHPGDPSIPGKDWEVMLLRTDGVVVSITEWNSAREKSAPITRDDPPFTIDELTTWAGLGAWLQLTTH